MTEVMFLCTGNLCRSPSAAMLLEQQLAQVGATGVAVHSAGTAGASGGPPDRLVNEGHDFGLDLGDHVSRRFDRAMIGDADLLLPMSREHLREVVLADPAAFAKTFTLREIVRRGSASGQRRRGEALPEWLARLHVGRRHADLLGDASEDDVTDPMGGSSDDYRRMLTDVAALTRSLQRLAWPTFEEDIP